MTTRSLTLVQAVFIAFLISLVPPAARSQQQEQPSVPPQEKTVGEQPQQTPAETAPEQQGTVIIPEQGKEAPEKAEAAPPKEAPKENGGRIYTIKQGDTLWDISNAYLKDPFLWPFVWKANLYITNPDLIYPGNKLVIPSLAPIERALQAATSLSGGTRVLSTCSGRNWLICQFWQNLHSMLQPAVAIDIAVVPGR